jgi:mannose-6-phosphate isomerase-like protein (cupin superfamily)
MKLVPKSESVKYQNAATCTAHEYETDTPDINLARVEVSGRYPEKGTAVNTEVTELVYVAAGSGVVSCNGVPTQLSEGDVVSIAPGEHVYWEGALTLVIACSPAWHPDQYVLKDD